MSLLTGIRVLDFGRFIAGPYCAALLGDLGADVIRIERVEGGEDRYVPPVADTGEGGLYLQMNRNKRCLTLDLASPQGRQIVRQLVATADVVVANLPPATLKQLGLDYATLSALNPRIVLAAVTAYGPGGPYSEPAGLRFDRPGDERRDVHVGPARCAGARRRALCRRQHRAGAGHGHAGRAVGARAQRPRPAGRRLAAAHLAGDGQLGADRAGAEGAQPRAAGQPRLHGRAQRPVSRPRRLAGGGHHRPGHVRALVQADRPAGARRTTRASPTTSSAATTARPSAN